jgi:NAD(P)-dependent dehydrogenase (short-subunit alcohol dehydrogenase family)
MSFAIDLSGKKALVTGGGRGLGRAIALALADAGADVAVTARTLAQIESVAAEVRAKGRVAAAIPCDVTDSASVDAMVARAVESLGGLHILVNNAGIERAVTTTEAADADFADVLDVNVKGALYVARACGRVFVPQKYGKVINMASVGGYVAAPRNAAYHASKAGMIMITKALAMEWTRHGISVNAIAPGWFRTELAEGMAGSEEQIAKFEKAIPARRLGRPEELGPLAVYLASDLSSYMCGTVVLIDGGLSAT